MSLTNQMKQEDLDRVVELLDNARQTDMFNMTSRDFSEFQTKVIWAIEDKITKQPVKPKFIGKLLVGAYCPVCNGEVHKNKMYCNCGQLLDWDTFYDELENRDCI